jgi:hypothetical protein
MEQIASTLELAFKILFFMFAFVFLLAIPLSVRLTRHLRDEHPSVWKSLGEPSLLNRSVSNDLKMRRFLLRAEYRKLDDPTLWRLGTAGRGLWLASYVLLGTAALVFVLRFLT